VRPLASRGFLLALALCASQVLPSDSPPLNNEAIVKMVVKGVPEAQILRAINSADSVAFDLDPDIVHELKAAGVSDRIVEAMRKRQREENPPPAEPQAVSVPSGTLRLRLSGAKPDEKKEEKSKPQPVVFEVIRKTPRWAANEMGMLQRTEVEDLAFFTVCTTPQHVPDHWQDRTELKDFVRHEKLLFRAGSRPGKSHGFEVLSLDLPDSLDVPIPEGTHRVVVGVAAKTGPDWHVLGSAERRDLAVSSGGVVELPVKLHSGVSGSRMIGFKEESMVTLGDPPPSGGAH
jgi:hypothetical protein